MKEKQTNTSVSVSPSLIHLVKMVAEDEHRSFSSMIAVFIREGLEKRGRLKVDNV